MSGDCVFGFAYSCYEGRKERNRGEGIPAGYVAGWNSNGEVPALVEAGGRDGWTNRNVC